jgi:Domain of unknown function (DUF6378)
MTNNNNEAQELLDSRLAVYGERKKNMENVAKVFSGILGIEVRPDQVPLLMVGYKTVRASQTPDYEDNVKDIEGYSLMFREIIGEDMIAAVNTDEYLAEKRRRTAPTVAELADLRAEQRRREAVEDHNRHVRAYNSRYEDEQPTAEQIPRMQAEVPSYQPGPGAARLHLAVYQQQLRDIFRRAWRAQDSIVPTDNWAEVAAREAVEYFWLTFQRNEELEARLKQS